MIDDATRKRIVEENSKWFEDGFAPLDMRGHPDYSAPSPEQDFIDDRFAPLDTRGTGLGLKEWLANPPEEAIDRVAAEAGDKTLRDRVSKARAEAISAQFVAANPEYYSHPGNLELIVETLIESAGMQELRDWFGHKPDDVILTLYERGVWTLENLQLAFDELYRQGELLVKPGSTKPISAEQLQECQLLAQSDLNAALARYLQFRLGLTDAEVQDFSRREAMKMMSNPDLRPVFLETALFGFRQMHPLELTQELIDYAAPYLSASFPTIKLLEAIYQKYEKERAEQQRSALFQPQEEQEIDLDSLDDSSVARVYQNILRANGRGVRLEHEQTHNSLFSSPEQQIENFRNRS